MNFRGLIALLLFMVAPNVLAAWLGTRLRRPLFAFVLAWLLAPILTFVIEIVLWPVLRALTPPNNDGTAAIMLPFYGIVTGIIAGGASAIIVSKRATKVTTTQTVKSESGTVPPKAEQDSQPAPPITSVE